MEERTLKIDLCTAKGWYYGWNPTLKTLALLAFSEEEILGDKEYKEKLRNDKIERDYIEKRNRKEYEEEKRRLRQLREWGDEWGDV